MTCWTRRDQYESDPESTGRGRPRRLRRMRRGGLVLAASQGSDSQPRSSPDAALVGGCVCRLSDTAQTPTVIDQQAEADLCSSRLPLVLALPCPALPLPRQTHSCPLRVATLADISSRPDSVLLRTPQSLEIHRLAWSQFCLTFTCRQVASTARAATNKPPPF